MKFPNSYTVNDKIFKPVSYALEKITLRNNEFKLESCVTGGIGVQINLFEEGILEDLRGTSDVDLVISNRINRSTFRKWIKDSLDGFEEKFENYEINIITNKKHPTYGVEISSENDEITLHFPRYPKQYWKNKKEDVLDIIKTADIKRLHGNKFKCANLEKIVEGKISRLKIKTRFNDHVLLKELKEGEKKILSDPQSWKLKIEFLRYSLGKAYEDNNFQACEKTKKIQNELSKAKDIYDLVMLKKAKNIEDLIYEKIKELSEEKVFGKKKF